MSYELCSIILTVHIIQCRKFACMSWLISLSNIEIVFTETISANIFYILKDLWSCCICSCVRWHILSYSSHILQKWRYLFSYLFVCDLFNNAVISSDCVTVSGRMINEWLIGIYVEGISHGLFQDFIPVWRSETRDRSQDCWCPSQDSNRIIGRACVPELHFICKTTEQILMIFSMECAD